jgi:hypothetical protein
MGKLGGIIGPIVDEAAVMAAEKSISYPLFHGFDLDSAQAGSVCHSRSGMPGENHAGHHISMSLPPLNMSNQTIGKIENATGNADVFIKFPLK